MLKAFCGVIVLLCGLSECSAQDKWVLPKLQELTGTETIGNAAAQLPAEDLSLLKSVTSKIIANCLHDPGPVDPHTGNAIFGHMRVRRVPLSPRGDAGLVAQGFGVCMCGAVGNCPFWVIAEQPHPRVALNAVGVQSFAFEKAATGGYFNLVLGSHDSAMVTDLQKFRFDGASYKRRACATLEWADLMGNALHPPRITPEQCP